MRFGFGVVTTLLGVGCFAKPYAIRVWGRNDPFRSWDVLQSRTVWNHRVFYYLCVLITCLLYTSDAADEL